MAIIAQNVRTSQGRVLSSAYIKVEVTGHTSRQCSMLLEVWEDSQDRQENDPLDRQTLGVQNPPDIAAANPLVYAYELLKQQPQFAGAVDV